MRTIVAGMDGSEGALIALRWAAHEAQMHDASLSALLAWSFLDQPGDGFTPTFGQDDALALLQQWLRDAQLPVEAKADIVCDLPPSALIEASGHADLVVVGSRGLGGFKELLLGSVSAALAERAVSPVAVVRRPGRPGGPVVVGIDGSANAGRALLWAAQEARVRRVELDVVHAWTSGDSSVLGIPFVVPAQHAEIAAEHALTAAMASVDLSGVIVHRHAIEGTPAGVLTDLSGSAGLVVVGSRGRGALTSVLLGSTSRQLLHHAQSPVVIVR